ncbi:unnamed protein product [Enterobius vermicularis]|uniref:7TM_GPCR_Srx domain-containing protein n=1 Tax=Enterobius vermicularis TaxID=51028 RepID=A0A0N4VRQ7_ENTVE|nr:unnamed protein product [Enterobius vermicularis]
MLSGNIFGQRASILAAEVLTLIALGLSIAAILMSSWQVVNLREYNSIHEHGLWLDCTRHTRDGPNNPLARRFQNFICINFIFVIYILRYLNLYTMFPSSLYVYVWFF